MKSATKIKVGDTVDNKGTTSKYRGLRGIVVSIRQVPNRHQMINVKYPNGKTEEHPDRIIEVVQMNHLPEDLFTL